MTGRPRAARQGSRAWLDGRSRTLLSLVLTAGIVASTMAAAPLPEARASETPAGASAEVSAAAVDEFAAARVRWRNHLTGGASYDPTSASYKPVVQRITSEAQTHWSSLYANPTTELWPDLTTATSVADTYEAYGRLKDMTLAFFTHGSTLEGDPALERAIIRSLDWLNAKRYNVDTVRDSSTWYWALGVPLYLNDITVLMYERLGADRIAKYMAAENRFLPGVYTTGVYSTGANRAWSVMVTALRGVITKDASKTTAARDGLTPVLRYVTSGDGYYRDGSYIQHTSLAYNGGYGVSALLMIGQVAFLFDGTPWQLDDPAMNNIYESVDSSYAPFVVNGSMMDTVRGKESSREQLDSRHAGSTTIRAIALLSETAPTGVAEELRARVERLLLDADLAAYRGTGSITDLTRSGRILGDSKLTTAAALDGSFAFNGMARFVKQAPGYAFSMSGSSARVTNFETGTSGENQKGWYTGDGMTYLYTDDTDQYSANYWATVNRYRLPGTTVDTRTKVINDGRNYRSKQTLVGGLSSPSGRNGAFGMVLDAANSPLMANKAWFTFDDEVVALGSGIIAPGLTGSGWDGSARHVETTVEDRRIESSDQSMTVDGAPIAAVGSKKTITDPSWAQLSGGVGQIGYVFPGREPVTVSRTKNTGSWFDINSKDGPRDIRTDSYFSLWMDHGKSPANATYSYVLLPNSTTANTRSYAAAPETKVLANTTLVSAVKEKTINAVGAVFWTDQPTSVSVDGKPFLSVTKKSVVVTEESSSGINVSVTDPTQTNAGTIAVGVQRSAKSVVAVSPGVTVTQLSPSIKFTVDVARAGGAKFTARFAY